MLTQDIQSIFDKHWQRGWGSVSVDETEYIQSLIIKHLPTSFLEIGMASGLSGGLIATILEERGGGYLCSIDHDNTFFGDNTKENGFLIEKIYQGNKVKVEKIPFRTSLDLELLGKTFDIAFVDANHQHPWPLLDTLFLYPYLKGNKIVIHHDLNLYKLKGKALGVGPKYLYDQFPESHRDRSNANSGNIFSLDLSLDIGTLEEIASNALHLPWTLYTPFSYSYIEAIRSNLEKHYSPYLLKSFEAALIINQPKQITKQINSFSNEQVSLINKHQNILNGREWKLILAIRRLMNKIKF